MKRSVIEKTDVGYTVRPRKGEQIFMLCVMIYFLLVTFFMLIATLAAWIENAAEGLASMIAVSVVSLLILTLVATILYTTWGAYMVIDREGVHFHRKLAKTKHIPWRAMRDWGIACQNGKGGYRYYLYFSTELLAFASWGRNKKLPVTFKKAVYLNINMKDIPLLKSSGLLTYCRGYLGMDDEFAENYVPMFVADFVL